LPVSHLAGLVLAIPVAVLITGCTSLEGPESDNRLHSKRESNSRIDRPRFDQPKLPMPPNGAGRDYDSPSHLGNTHLMALGVCGTSDWAGSGTLNVTVPPGRDSYFAKVTQPGSRRDPVAWVVVRPGGTARIDVPVCERETNYSLYYGAGTKWYGEKYVFGPDGAYGQANKVFSFSEGAGWSVSLSLQVNGNLPTKGMGYDSFID